MKTRKTATDEAFLNEAKTLLALPPEARSVALDMLGRLRSSLDLMEFMGFADEGMLTKTPEQEKIANQMALALAEQNKAGEEAQAALAKIGLLLVGRGKKLSPDEVVTKVADLAVAARAGHASGGNGTPWSAVISDKNFSLQSFVQAEAEIGASLHGLAKNAALLGIEVVINCTPMEVGPVGSFTLSGGVRRGRRIEDRLALQRDKEDSEHGVAA